MSSIDFNPTSTVEMLFRSSPEKAADFAVGSQVVRAAIQASRSDVLVLPERGSMPIFWAASRSNDTLTQSRHRIIRPPIGSRSSIHDHVGTTSLNKPQKEHLLTQLVEDKLIEDKLIEEEITLIDEVQHGGTIHTAALILSRILGKDKLHVIAGQDTTIKNSASMSRGFRSMATNRSSLALETTVVPMPLIGTDRDSLLNRLERTDKNPHDSLDVTIDIVDNILAERIFRAMGSIAHNSHDQDSQRLLSNDLTKAAADSPNESMVQDWVANFVSTTKDRVTKN